MLVANYDTGTGSVKFATLYFAKLKKYIYLEPTSAMAKMTLAILLADQGLLYYLSPTVAVKSSFLLLRFFPLPPVSSVW